MVLSLVEEMGPSSLFNLEVTPEERAEFNLVYTNDSSMAIMVEPVKDMEYHAT